MAKVTNATVVNVGDKVKVLFRKYGKHIFEGTVTEVSVDEHALEGTWVSVMPTACDFKDTKAMFYIINRIRILVPINDVLLKLNA